MHDTGLGQEADATLASASRKLQAQSSQAACTATGACTAPRIASTTATDQSGFADDEAKAAASPTSAPGPAAGPAATEGNQGQNAQAM